jgi:hypothetical protein
LPNPSNIHLIEFLKEQKLITEETEKGENSRPATQGNPDDNGSNPPAGCSKVITAPKVQIDTKTVYNSLKKITK